MSSAIREILVLHHSQPVIWEMHREYLDQALDLLNETAGWPEPSRPKWTCGVTRNGLLGEVISGPRFTLPTAPNETLDLAPAAAYDIWAQQITNAASRDPAADADDDCYANLLEYVTGGNPMLPDNQSRLSASVANGTFSLNFTRNTNTTDATIIVQRADALTNGVPWVGVATNRSGVWTGSVVVQESGAGNPLSVVVQDSTSSSAARFYRLYVTQP
jgi:hypothetical protein